MIASNDAIIARAKQLCDAEGHSWGGTGNPERDLWIMRGDYINKALWERDHPIDPVKTKAKTVTVRVRLAVSAEGKWYAYGADNMSVDDADAVVCDMATDADFTTLAWRTLVAEVELPQEADVPARVENDT